MKRFLSVIPFAFLLFRFEIKSISQFAQMIFVVIIAIIYLLYNNKYWKKYNRLAQITKGFLIFIFFIIISLVCIQIHGTNDTSYILKILSYIYNLLFWDVFIVHILKLTEKNNTADVKEIFVIQYCNVMILYIAFTLICIALPGFRDWWISIIHINELEMSLSQQARYTARIGWNGFAGFGATFRCCLGIIFCLDLLNSKKIYISKKQIYFYIVFLFLGNILYGRIGIVSSCIIIAYMGVVQLIKKGKVGLIVSILIGLLLFVISINVFKDSSEIIGNIYRWSFEPLLNYLSGKGLSSGSTDSLFNMYKIGKPSLQTFWFGDGFYTNYDGGYYKYVDPGILRFILFWGIIPSILAYIILLKVIRTSFFNETNTFVMLLIILALFEFKGEICMHSLYIFCAISILSPESSTVRRKYVPKRHTKDILKLKNKNST